MFKRFWDDFEKYKTTSLIWFLMIVKIIFSFLNESHFSPNFAEEIKIF